MCRDNPKELGKIMQLHKEEEQQQQQQQQHSSSKSSPSISRTHSPRSSDAAAATALPPPSPSPPSPSPSIKRIPATLLCRRSDGRVLYMEAGKDLVDALMGFLTLPLGAALRLLSAARSPPRVAISSVFSSALDLDDSLFCSEREALVDPKPGIRAADLFASVSSSHFAPLAQSPLQLQQSHVYYKCSNHGCLRFVIDLPGQICPVCKFAMSHKLELIVPGAKGPYPSPSPSSSPLPVKSPKPGRSGFVKKNRTFIVTDELEILPMSTIRSLILLGKLKLDSLQDLDSVQVTVGTAEMLELLKASLSSQTALNDVFRVKTPAN